MQALGELGTTYLLRGRSHPGRAVSCSAPWRSPRRLASAADGSVWARNLAAAFVALGRWDDAAKYNEEARRLNPPNRAGQTGVQHRHDQRRSPLRAATPHRPRDCSTRCSPDRRPNRACNGWRTKASPTLLSPQASRPTPRSTSRPRSQHDREDAIGATENGLPPLVSDTADLIFIAPTSNFLMANGQSDRALEVADSSRGRVLAERLGVAAPIARRGRRVPPARAGERSGARLLLARAAAAHWHGWSPASGIRSLPAGASATKSSRWSSSTTRRFRTHRRIRWRPPTTARRSLYARIVAPLAAALPRNAKLVIVPDGALHRLNFETLPVRTGGNGALLD